MGAGLALRALSHRRLTEKEVTRFCRLPLKTESLDPAPKMLPGFVCAQYVRCGRPRCRCMRGQRHGPYHFRYWWEGARRRKAYVRPQELEKVRAQCEARRNAQRDFRTAW